MIEFLIFMGIIHLVSLCLGIIWIGSYFIWDFIYEKRKSKLNIERIIDEESKK